MPRLNEKTSAVKMKSPLSKGGTYLAARSSSLWMIKDMILVCLAIPGFFALIQPTAVCKPGGVLYSGYTGSRMSQQALDICDCGNSTAEALSLGCVYDSLAAAWLPPHCRDTELTKEFDMAGDGPDGEWKYWLDTNRSQEITLQDLGTKGDDPDFRFYSTMEWHAVHCLFYWRKQIRARTMNLIVEPRYNSEEHTVHCGHVFRQDINKGLVQAGVALKSDILA